MSLPYFCSGILRAYSISWSLPMTRLRIVMLSAIAIVCFAFGAICFVCVKRSPPVTRQQPVEPSDDGARAAVLVKDPNGDHWEVIDIHGKRVFALQPHVGIDDFSEGLAAVALSWLQSGYVDSMGKIVIPAQFYRTASFREHRALVQLDVEDDFRFGYVDPSGKMVVPAQYFDAHSFSEGLAAVKIFALESIPTGALLT